MTYCDRGITADPRAIDETAVPVNSASLDTALALTITGAGSAPSPAVSCFRRNPSILGLSVLEVRLSAVQLSLLPRPGRSSEAVVQEQLQEVLSLQITVQNGSKNY